MSNEKPIFFDLVKCLRNIPKGNMLGVALGRVMLEIVKVNTLAGAERGEDGGRYHFITWDHFKMVKTSLNKEV